MKSSDRNLGMDRPISRRDLLLGMGASAASAFVPGQAFADEMQRLEGTDGPYYPPGLTGLRGSHVGSFEVAHQLAGEGAAAVHRSRCRAQLLAVRDPARVRQRYQPGPLPAAIA